MEDHHDNDELKLSDLIKLFKLTIIYYFCILFLKMLHESIHIVPQPDTSCSSNNISAIAE